MNWSALHTSVSGIIHDIGLTKHVNYSISLYFHALLFSTREIYLHMLVVSRDDVLCIKDKNVYSSVSTFKVLLCLC